MKEEPADKAIDKIQQAMEKSAENVLKVMEKRGTSLVNEYYYIEIKPMYLTLQVMEKVDPARDDINKNRFDEIVERRTERRITKDLRDDEVSALTTGRGNAFMGEEDERCVYVSARDGMSGHGRRNGDAQMNSRLRSKYGYVDECGVGPFMDVRSMNGPTQLTQGT